MKLLLSLDCAVETMPVITYIGVVLPYVGSLSLDRYHFDVLMGLKEMLMFPLVSNLVLH